jgi:hypothetical protein
MNERVEYQLGKIQELLDNMEAQDPDPAVQKLIDSVRDRLNVLTPESRPYFSPKEEAARIELWQELSLREDKDSLYYLEFTVGEAMKHLDYRTSDGLSLTRLHMELRERTLH